MPPGSAVTSTAGLASGLLGNPLSTVPQQALLAVAVAAAGAGHHRVLREHRGGVRQRRAENALLAALGVTPRAAAGQLCLEKLMLSLPSALAGLVLGVVLAERLVRRRPDVGRDARVRRRSSSSAGRRRCCWPWPSPCSVLAVALTSAPTDAAAELCTAGRR